MLKLDGIELTFTADALEELAERCLKLKTGARGLHTEIERVLMPHMYHTRRYRENDIKTINIDKEKVLNPKPLL